MNPLRTLLPALLLLGALPGTALAEEHRTIAVQAQLHELPFGFHIAPERIDASVGDTLTVEVINLGKTRHDLVFCAKPGPAPCTERLAATPNALATNETANLTVKPTQPGSYIYYCTLPGHLEGGMKGEMIVAGEATQKETPGPAPLLVALAALGAALVLRRGWRA